MESFSGSILRYPQVSEVQVEIAERTWKRLEIDGKPHAHSFEGGEESKMFTRAVCTRQSQTVQSAVRDLLIVKSTDFIQRGVDI